MKNTDFHSGCTPSVCVCVCVFIILLFSASFWLASPGLLVNWLPWSFDIISWTRIDESGKSIWAGAAEGCYGKKWTALNRNNLHQPLSHRCANAHTHTHTKMPTQANINLSASPGISASYFSVLVNGARFFPLAHYDTRRPLSSPQ